MISPQQFTQLTDLMNRADLSGRRARREFAVTTLGRPIDAVRDLTQEEAAELIDVLRLRLSDPPGVTA